METMTVQEFADVMGTTSEAVKWHIRKEYPDLMRHGVQTRLTQEQVTLIKSKMTETSGLVSAKTELEIMEGGLQYIQWLQSKVQEQKQALETAQPKIEFHDAVTESDSCFGMSQAVKILNLTLGRNHFYTLLKADGIVNLDREPYQKYIDDGYFRVTVKPLPNGKTQTVTLVTGKGLAWLQKRYDHIRLKEVI